MQYVEFRVNKRAWIAARAERYREARRVADELTVASDLPTVPRRRRFAT